MQSPHLLAKYPPTPPEMWKTVRGDPARDLLENTAKNDLRFRAVLMGAGIYTPSWPQAFEELSTVVVAGGDCVTHYRDEDALRKAALSYSERYNRLLVAHLKKIQHPLVLEAAVKAEEIMAVLEKADPVKDAQVALATAQGAYLVLLAVEDEPGKIQAAGIGPKEQALLKRERITEAYRRVPIGKMFLSPAQAERAARVCQLYIIPYNRYLFAHRKK